MRKPYFLLFLLLPFFTSCEKDPDPVTEVTPAMARDTLYYVMRHWYYWYDKMPSVTKENFSDPYGLLEAMRYKTLDRWSRVMDYDDFMDDSQGIFVGHGFRVGLDQSSVPRIAMIFKNSALYSQGVRRGWIVRKINNVEIAPLLIAGNVEAYLSLVGAAVAEVTNQFLFQKPDGSEVDISATKSTFNINSVLLYDTLHLSSGITGHLVFEEFQEFSEDELKTAFAFFRANNVKDLILDLRYNLGGVLSVAQSLASYIGGTSLAGRTFTMLRYNDKNQSANSTYTFKTMQYPLALSRVAIITTRSSASASELIINGLKPFIDVVTIGDTTRGKPVGMNVWFCGEKYAFLPITFKTVNADNEAEYYDGIFPSKQANDDIRYDFDSRKEESLSEAIRWMETGTFTAKGTRDFRRSVHFSEKMPFAGTLVFDNPELKK